MNKYNRWYNQLISKAKDRVLEGYSEKHHIVPKSLGGNDDLFNLVQLTAREHFICHWLLTKMHNGEAHHKMLNALRMMRAEKPGQERYKTKITSRVYENLKEEYSKLQSKRFSGAGNGMYKKNHTEEAKRAIGEKNSGRVQPQQEKEKQVAAQTGRKRKPFSEEHRANLSKSGSGENNSMFDKKHKESSLAIMREKATGRKQSAETIKKKADAIRGSKREKKHCIHCGRDIAVNTYPRFHGEKCKSKT
jgi:hypothetical protein